MTIETGVTLTANYTTDFGILKFIATMLLETNRRIYIVYFPEPFNDETTRIKPSSKESKQRYSPELKG